MQAGGQGFDPPNLHKLKLNGSTMKDFTTAGSRNSLTLIQNLVVFVVCFFVITVRSINSFTEPFLYAEDGVWLSNVLQQGFLGAAFNSRPDYPIFLQASLLQIVTVIGKLIFGSPLSQSPLIISVVSNLFLTVVFYFIYLALRKTFTFSIASVILALAVFVPVGITSNEIYGRILQIGFFLPAWCWAIVELRSAPGSKLRNLMFDLLIGLSIFTNPITVVTVWCHIFLRKPSALLRLSEFAKTWWTLIAITLIFLGQEITIRVPGTGGIPGGLNPQGIVGYFVRSSVFSIIGYPYTIGSLYFWLGMSIVLAILCWVGWWKLTPTYRSNSSTLFVLWLVLTTGGLIARPGLTGFTVTNASSFPDRYFIASNIFFTLFVFSLLFGERIKNLSTKTQIRKTLLALSLLCVIGSQAFELAGPRMIIATDVNYSWHDNVCQARKVSLNNSFSLNLWPDGWAASFPSSALNQKNCE